MRIENISQGVKVTQPNQRNSGAKEKGATARSRDLVEISDEAKALNSRNAADVTETNSTAEAVATRRDKLAKVVDRINSGFYESRVVRKKIADALFNKGGVANVVRDIVRVNKLHQTLDAVPDVRQEKVLDAQHKVSTDFYDSYEVRLSTAGTILDEMVE